MSCLGFLCSGKLYPGTAQFWHQVNVDDRAKPGEVFMDGSDGAGLHGDPVNDQLGAGVGGWVQGIATLLLFRNDRLGNGHRVGEATVGTSRTKAALPVVANGIRPGRHRRDGGHLCLGLLRFQVPHQIPYEPLSIYIDRYKLYLYLNNTFGEKVLKFWNEGCFEFWSNRFLGVLQQSNNIISQNIRVSLSAMIL